MEQGTISRSALGSVARLGDLYDARSDRFCGLSLLKQEAPAAAVQVGDSPFQDTKFLTSDKTSDKLDHLDVKAELKLSVMAGLFTLEGSGRYLRDEKSSARAARCTLMHSIRTKVEQLNIFNDQLAECIAIQALEQEQATHVVVGISWGANLLVTAEYANEENEDVLKVTGALQASLEKAAFAISGKASVDYGTNNKQIVTNFSLKVYGDVLPDGDLPQTIEGALELMKKVPVLIQSANNGKGKPLEYVLLPISTLKSQFKLNTLADTFVRKLSEEAILRFVQLFDVINEAKQKLNDLYKDVTKYDFCLLDSTRKAVEDLKSNADIAEARIRHRLSSLLLDVRAGKAEPITLEELRQEYENDQYSAQNIMKIIRDQFGHVRPKIDLYLLLTSNHGMTLVPKNEPSLVQQLVQFYGKDVFVLFVTSNEDKGLWSENLHLFLNLWKNSSSTSKDGGTGPEKTAFLYVDLDVAPHLAPKDVQGPLIQHFKDGSCLSSDVYAEYLKEREVCFAKSTAVEFTAAKPNKRAALEMICPASIYGQCEREQKLWKCFKCKAEIEYGFDGYFYCTCGKAKAGTFTFRCSSKRHGEGFEKFKADETTLTDILGRLKPMKEMNILILGETGVGKSTWINGIVNYLSYHSLEEAEKNELLSVIPMSFSMTNDNYDEVVISTGEDTNEDPAAGNSATQFPKSYTFTKGDVLVRLIDTPGIGDVRGLHQDKENFRRILNHLSFIDEIHGICILLKPNNARLTIVFQFCIKELLTHLHRDASKNIVFCFTNARSTLYRPGDTLPALKKLLGENKDVEIPVSKHTLYCMDNEAIRFLAAVKHGEVSFDETDRKNFSASWDKSVDETDRLFTHISQLEPHKTKDTLSLNDARRLITELTKPLADISKNIQDNIMVVEDKEEEIKKIDATRADLSKHLQIPHIDLVTEELGHHRTVCGNSKCVEIIMGKNNISHPVYKQVCHEICGISGVSTGTKSQPELQSCLAMAGPAGNRYCAKCGCPWFEHMHQTYRTIKVDTVVVDPNVEKQLLDRANNLETIRNFVQSLQRKIQVLKSEQEVVTKASAEFAAFLHNNAITPYNDVLADYLDHLIQVEKNKVNVGTDKKGLNSLIEMKSQYEEEVKILQESISLSQIPASQITPQRIKDLIEKLYNLSESGPKLKQMMSVVTTANRKAAAYSEASMGPKRKPRSAPKKTGWRSWFGF